MSAPECCHVLHRHPLLAGETATQGFAGNQRHHVKKPAVGFAGIKQRDDSRMNQLRHQCDLALKAFRSDGVRELLGEYLDGDRPIEMIVVGAVYDCHSAAADFLVYAKPGWKGDWT
jgi:hypothetical protein